MKTKGSVNIPDEIREKVKIMAIQGHSEPYIAKKFNIANSSVHRIKKEIDGLESLRENKKQEIINKLWEIVLSALNSITDEKIKKMSAYQIMLTAAVAADKAQLLSGEATERLELSQSEIDRKLNELEIAEKELKEAWERAQKQKQGIEAAESPEPSPPFQTLV
jgi:hypothetical protein